MKKHFFVEDDTIKMDKIKNSEKLAHKVYLKVHPRIVELVDKFVKGNFNGATMYAFQMGFEADVLNVLGEQK
jgi:hypothetical protein